MHKSIEENIRNNIPKLLHRMKERDINVKEVKMDSTTLYIYIQLTTSFSYNKLLDICKEVLDRNLMHIWFFEYNPETQLFMVSVRYWFGEKVEREYEYYKKKHF